MRFFGLSPEEVEARVRLSPARRLPSEAGSVLIGTAGFTLVSFLVFATVALWERQLYSTLGVAGAYVLWTLLFFVGTPLALSPVLIGPGATKRFAGVFALGFGVFAALWCAGWFGLRGRPGELVGTVAGSIGMGWVVARAFRSNHTFSIVTVMTLGFTAAYFAGEVFWRTYKAQTGMLLWGLFFGIFGGAALGLSLWMAQEPIRRRLKRE